ncbi:MAG: hypothetical protein HZC01_04035 [Candidatus Kerfeldbacteria bacterium]|nr:hypothetical protein [Candidatus Kerfeldbacteria bacterium]
MLDQTVCLMSMITKVVSHVPEQVSEHEAGHLVFSRRDFRAAIFIQASTLDRNRVIVEELGQKPDDLEIGNNRFCESVGRFVCEAASFLQKKNPVVYHSTGSP